MLSSILPSMISSLFFLLANLEDINLIKNFLVVGTISKKGQGLKDYLDIAHFDKGKSKYEIIHG